MDKSTHEIRLAQWKRIIEQCQHRPEGQSIKQWLADNQIKEKTYYYWQRKIRKDVIEQMRGNVALPSVSTQKSSIVSFAEISFDNQASEAYPASFQPTAVRGKTGDSSVSCKERKTQNRPLSCSGAGWFVGSGGVIAG